MSRVRWILAGALGLVAFVATVQALRTYLAHDLTVGVLAVAALAVTLAVGLGSLGWARRRIERELAGLRATPPTGELLGARRRRLDAIKAAGARPDRDVLSQATAAAEAGRAYIGRYLVTTTVLMGLVGTFAGLMETLGKIGPIVGQSQGGEAGALALLAAPLAGLHVTFGASLVAILATLALALAQGDLALHEELALATLEDRTTHELIPKLWPPAEDAAERTVRAVDELKTMMAEALARSLEKSAKRIAENARAEGERTARTLEAAAATVEREIARLCETVTTATEESARRQGAALAEATKAAVRAATETAEIAARATLETTQAAVRGALEATGAAVRTAAAEMARTIEPLFAAEGTRLEAVRDALVEAARRIEAAAERLGAIEGTVQEVSREQVASMDRAGQAVLTAFDRAVVGGGAALDGAAAKLATAATALGAGADAFGPKIATLAAELGALGREVALLAARDPEGDLGAVVLGELERLGAGVDRLNELARLGAVDPVSALEVPAPETIVEEAPP